MTMIAADRARFLELMMELGPDASHVAVLGFVRQHLDAARAEMGARPGMDRVRAGLLRLLPELDVDAAAWRHEALVALQAYGEDVADPDPAVLIERPPAWVGLAWLEAHEAEGWTSACVDKAAELCALGFEAAGLQGIGDGEVVWALAEAAAEVGWENRERFLLDEARRRPFAEDHHACDVAFLYGLRALSDGDEDGIEVLEGVLTHEQVPHRIAVHARAVLGAVAPVSYTHLTLPTNREV